MKLEGLGEEVGVVRQGVPVGIWGFLLGVRIVGWERKKGRGRGRGSGSGSGRGRGTYDAEELREGLCHCLIPLTEKCNSSVVELI